MRARPGIEQVDYRQRLVHAHQDFSLRRRTAPHEREVNRTERQVPIGHQMKTSPGRLDVALQDALHQRFISAAVLDQIGDGADPELVLGGEVDEVGDRKSTRLNSSHVRISYAVFCLKKKK